ncbi:MAG TPA: YdcF family protein, partial [Candidatus Binatia bacterium]|nr:YdcF family protein [Candidatus Binatia bacterium]
GIFILHNPYVGRELYYGLESRYPPLIDPARAEPYDAIVVLMAGTIPAGGLVPFPTVSGPLFHRLDEAWRLYRIRPKPIVVSGGHVDPLTQPYNENQIACDYLILWGVPRDQIISETRARDTFESAIEVEKIVRQKGWKRYLLVTSAVHMPRSMLAFSSLAPVPIPAPGDFNYVGGPFRILLAEEAADRIADATHEYLGILNYHWRLRFYQKTEAASGTVQ